MPLKGYKQTKEHKKMLSIAHKGKTCDGRTLKKYYCIDCGKELSNYKAKRCKSCAKRGKRSSLYKDGKCLRKYYCMDCGKELKSYYAKRCLSCSNKIIMKKNWQNPEYREKTIKEMNAFEYKKERSKISKKQWEDGIYDGVFMSPTNPEKEIMRILEELKINYIFQFRPEGYSKPYDFYISNMNLLIEFDGVYWHSLPEVKERDIEKTEYADKNNYILLRFNENSLDSFESLILEKIKKEENYART